MPGHFGGRAIATRAGESQVRRRLVGRGHARRKSEKAAAKAAVRAPPHQGEEAQRFPQLGKLGMDKKMACARGGRENIMISFAREPNVWDKGDEQGLSLFR